MKKVILGLIRFYQRLISPLKRNPTCMFTPTCSQYTYEAVKKYGVGRGLWIGVKRIVRCHPWQKDWGHDPLP